MRAITVCQPYAHLIALPDDHPEVKRVENRNQAWNYRGFLAIHAGLSKKRLAGDNYGFEVEEMAFGAIVAVARLVACFEVVGGEFPADCWLELYPFLMRHKHAEGPFCLILENVKALATPVPCKGALGLWAVPNDITERVKAQCLT